MPSQIQNLRQDPPLVQDSNYKFDDIDRQYIDSQVLGCEAHLLQSLLSGVNATWFLNDDIVTLQPGMVVTTAGAFNNGPAPFVIKATPGILSATGIAVGVVLTPSAPNTRVLVAMTGILPPSVTGLGNLTGFARVSSTGTVERVVALSPFDYPLGSIDGFGNLTLRTGSKTTSTAVTQINNLDTALSADPTWTSLISFSVTGSRFLIQATASGVATSANVTPKLRVRIDGSAIGFPFTVLGSNVATNGAGVQVTLLATSGQTAGSHLFELQATYTGTSPGWSILGASDFTNEGAFLSVTAIA